MDLRTILRFQFGEGDAIKSVARSRTALLTGLVLVLLTSIPRNYDQSFILESPLWLFGPLIFSCCSGSFLFFILYKGFIRRRLQSPETVSTASQWRGFMSLFWMTAPVAWLYAIPVERFLDSYHAAQANLALLAIVSLWRVLLMSRVISVLQQISFARAFGWVLVPASLEVVLVVFLGFIFSPHFSRAVLAGMGGMRNSPEERLIILALGSVWWGALILLSIVIMALCSRQFSGWTQPFPDRVKSTFPVHGLLFLAAVWIAMAIPAQLEQKRFIAHCKLIGDGRFRESIEYLAHYHRKDFPASRRIEPNPYEYRVWELLPEVVARLQPTDPEWIRQIYLSHMDVLFSHEWLYCKPDALARMFGALEHLPEAKGWIQRNRPELSKLKNAVAPSSRDDAATTKAQKEVHEILLRLGVDLDTLSD